MEQELAAVIGALPEDLKDLVRFGAATGMRRAEIISLEWSDLHGDELTLRGENSKNGDARNIPIVAALGAIIERRRAASRAEEKGAVRMAPYIFSRDGAAVGRFNKASATACVAAKCGVMVCPKCNASSTAHACEACKVNTLYRGKLFHELQRHAVRSMTRAGVPQVVAMKISGHKTDACFGGTASSQPMIFARRSKRPRSTARVKSRKSCPSAELGQFSDNRAF